MVVEAGVVVVVVVVALVVVVVLVRLVVVLVLVVVGVVTVTGVEVVPPFPFWRMAFLMPWSKRPFAGRECQHVLGEQAEPRNYHRPEKHPKA